MINLNDAKIDFPIYFLPNFFKAKYTIYQKSLISITLKMLHFILIFNK